MSDSATVNKRNQRRYRIDGLTRWMIGAGGATVIIAITLIFGFLLWVVAPMLLPGSITEGDRIATTERQPILIDVSENGEVLVRITADGFFEFYSRRTGAPVVGYDLGYHVRDAVTVQPDEGLYALVAEDGRLRLVRASYGIRIVQGVRTISPSISYPYPESEIQTSDGDLIDLHKDPRGNLMVAIVNGRDLRTLAFRNLDPGYPLRIAEERTHTLSSNVSKILLGPRNDTLNVMYQSGDLAVLDLSLSDSAFTEHATTATAPTNTIGALLGRYSILIAGEDENITQWGLNAKDRERSLVPMRTFETSHPVNQFSAEPRRKGFVALDAAGQLSLFYPTSHRRLDTLQTDLPPETTLLKISPRADLLIAAPNQRELRLFTLENEHPELSITALWGRVWYEGYEGPVFSWQSSSADSDFEPKFSLTPLAFGTFKAAMYALMFAIPLAILGAIYTAYFMSPAMRAWIKPGIEIMAALPTVILGFIGGLWLAPLVEANLSSVLAILIGMPLTLFVLAIGWHTFAPHSSRRHSSWYGLYVIPLIALVTIAAFQAGPILETTFFDGDSRAWFRDQLGWDYDQRNALVVGIVMGLAVIPTIFSISEDAIYNVPRNLVDGSLAMGASPWQTLTQVVLLTASPAIFSAVMIGTGRAVGETMIVLMATGNTPIMDFNIFEGMRTFAANLAVELPESEVNSTHYRILFLSALVLFVLTFVLNTLGDIVRQRLRERYGSL